MILDSATVESALILEADAVVVGSGAGGSVAARELAAGGLATVLLEEGRYWTNRDFTQIEEEMYPRLYRERGTKPTTDFSVLVSQGRALGGSMVSSFCLCFRPPRQILDDWRERFSLEDLSHERLFPHIERVEKTIRVAVATPDQLNANNRMLLRGSERLGYRGRFVRHNRTDCLGCGYCALGCAYDRKNDMLTTYLADASRLGVRILPEARASRVIVEDGRAAGVAGEIVGAGRKKRDVRVHAPIVVIAAGALESPLLWLRSGLPDPDDVAGRHLHLQPYVVVAGIFDEPIAAWDGMPQSYVVDEFLNLDKRIDGGHLLVSASAQPITFASMIPGLGAEHRRLMTEYARIGLVAFSIHDRTEGVVRVGPRQQAVIDYELLAEDEREVMAGMKNAAEILFAAGARSVVLPYNDVVELKGREQLEIIESRGVMKNDPLLLSFQPQGTLRMGGDPEDSIVDSRGKAHGIEGVFVADASVFPTSVAVPPQISVMAFAARTAEGILANRA